MLNVSWDKYKKYLYYDKELQLMLDISRMYLFNEFFSQMANEMKNVYSHISQIENGYIANPDENRMVGHYWLRNPDLAPDKSIAMEITSTIKGIKEFAQKVHSGDVITEQGKRYKNILLIGIGGSSLGPRFISDALSTPKDKMKVYFIDNTDPDGMDRVLINLEQELDTTLCIVISKSGGTIETRNGMIEAETYYAQKGLNFAKHAISITQPGSKLAEISFEKKWLITFPMWDWVGGRTSVLSAVGLLTLALQGIDIDSLLLGAKKCDERTRLEDTMSNPAALLALMWYSATKGQGGKQMVMLPYKDRLELLTKYLQQLVMESLGKEKDLDGQSVKQGITVLGNKGSTDQHSYVQQLLDGPDNFFVTFIEVLKDREKESPIIADESTSGDYLQAFLLGTREALTVKGKESITITVNEVSAYTLGVLIALYERAVSIYAVLVNINAYHQPAVEMGKKSAGEVIELKNSLLKFFRKHKGNRYTVEDIAVHMGFTNELEIIFKILLHLAENPDHGIKVEVGDDLFKSYYYF